MKKLLLGALLLALGLGAWAANSTTQGTAGNAGLDKHDTTTSGAILGGYFRDKGDCSAQSTASPLSYTSSAINISFTAGINWATNSYGGKAYLYAVNTGNSTLVAWVAKNTATIAGTTPAGIAFAAGKSVEISAQAIDGTAFHLQGLTNTSSVNYTICTE